MDQRSPRPVGQSPSWIRVILDTVKLSLERSRQLRLQHDDHRRSRLWIPVLFGLVVLGGGLLVKATSESANPVPDAAPTTGTTSDSQQQRADPTGFASRAPGESSRAISSRTATLSRAAAGAEIAGRADIDVSPGAAAVLREGTVDGRVLVVLAALATADLLTVVDVPPSGSSGSADIANLELGVVDVDRVLDWLDGQSRLRPERVEARRESSVTYVLLIYNTPEPPGLFPS